VLLNTFRFIGITLGFHPQVQKLETCSVLYSIINNNTGIDLLLAKKGKNDGQFKEVAGFGNTLLAYKAITSSTCQSRSTTLVTSTT